MKPQEVRELADAELATKARELNDELFHLRLRRATSQLGTARSRLSAAPACSSCSSVGPRSAAKRPSQRPAAFE